MKPAPPELVRVVADDLEYLETAWPAGDLSDAEVRRSSTVLRRLLTYRDLIRVWLTVIGPEDFVVPAAYLRVLDPTRMTEVDFMSLSPADQGSGMKIYGVMVFNRIYADGDSKPFTTVDEVRLPLKRFLDRPACVVEGVAVTRDELVQFVANKMGGAHFDESRQKPREIAISAMERYQVGNRPALIHEMLSYGQTLAAAPSTELLFKSLGR